MLDEGFIYYYCFIVEGENGIFIFDFSFNEDFDFKNDLVPSESNIPG